MPQNKYIFKRKQVYASHAMFILVLFLQAINNGWRCSGTAYVFNLLTQYLIKAKIC